MVCDNRHVLLHSLLDDALTRAKQYCCDNPPIINNTSQSLGGGTTGDNVHDVISRMSLAPYDSRGSVSTLLRLKEEEGRQFHVVYLDPMYPINEGKKNKAKPKKNIAQARELVGFDSDTVDLFNAARSSVIHKVVWKRPR